MKVYTVLYEVKDDYARLLGVYSSQENANHDWGNFIQQQKNKQWEWCRIVETDLDAKNPKLRRNQYGDLADDSIESN